MINLFLVANFWWAKIFNQTFYVLSATANAHGGIGLFFDLFNGYGAIHYGINNLDLRHLITGT